MDKQTNRPQNADQLLGMVADAKRKVRELVPSEKKPQQIKRMALELLSQGPKYEETLKSIEIGRQRRAKLSEQKKG